MPDRMQRSDSAQSSREVLSNVQALRAIAALLVVLYHAIQIGGMTYGFQVDYLRPFIGWGQYGVDLFFVISGFIMVYIQRDRPGDPIEFLKRRVIRIVPLYWILTLLMFAMQLALPAHFNTSGFGLGWLLSSLTFSSQVLSARSPMLFDGWTLEYEMFFYLIFAMSLTLGSAKASRVACMAAVVAWSIAFRQYVALEFVYGMAIGAMYTSNRPFTNRFFLVGAVGVALFAASSFAGVTDSYRAIAFGVPSALIVFASVFGRQRFGGIVTRIGDASYSIYLVQVFTIAAFFKGIAAIGVPKRFADLGVVLCVTLTTLAGWIVYVWVLQPLTARLTQRLFPPTVARSTLRRFPTPP